MIAVIPPSLALLKFIGSWEGDILQAYDDYNDKVVPIGGSVRGTLTIGKGHTNAAGPPPVEIGMMITEQQSDDFLRADLQPVVNTVCKLVTVPLSQCEADSLYSFEYNTGWLEHPHCSLLAAVNAGNFNLAEQDFMLYDEAQGRVLAGLVRRRTAERLMFTSGLYQGSDGENVNV